MNARCIELSQQTHSIHLLFLQLRGNVNKSPTIYKHTLQFTSTNEKLDNIFPCVYLKNQNVYAIVFSLYAVVFYFINRRHWFKKRH